MSARTDDGYSEVTDQAAFLLEEKCVPIEEVHVLQSDMLLGRENEELRGKDDDLASGNQQGNKEESLSVEDQLKSTANNEGDIVLNGVMEHNHREGLNNKTVSVSKEFTETTGRSNITPVVMALIESQRQSTPAHNLINSCSKNHDTCATDSDHSHCSSVPQSCPTPSIATTCQRHIFFEDNNATLKIPLKKIAFPHDADTVNCLKNMRPFDIILERTPPKSSQSGTINVFHSKMLTLPAAKGQKGQPVQRGKTKRRRSSRTSSQSSSHHATEGDYHCSGAHASSGVGHTSSPPSKSSSPRKRRRRRAQSEDQYNSDSRLICILCGLHDNAQGLGYLYGPYKCLLSSSPHDDEGALNGDQSNGTVGVSCHIPSPSSSPCRSVVASGLCCVGSRGVSARGRAKRLVRGSPRRN